MTMRKGLGKGTGSGYRNMIPKDPSIHSQSSRGIKQPQRMNPLPFKSYSPIGEEVDRLRKLGFELSFSNDKYASSERSPNSVYINHKYMAKPVIVQLSQDDTWLAFFKRNKEDFENIFMMGKQR